MSDTTGWRHDVENAPRDGTVFEAIIEYASKLNVNKELFIDFVKHERDPLDRATRVLVSVEGFTVRGEMKWFRLLDLPEGNYPDLSSKRWEYLDVW